MSGPPPTPDQIVVALDALRHDAARWRAAAGDMARATDTAVGLALDPAVFSFAGAAAATAYARLQDRMVVLLRDGAENCASVGAALDGVATVYAAEEKAGVHRARGVY